MSQVLRSGAGSHVVVSELVANPGGQGSVYAVTQPAGHVLKRFHPEVLAKDPGLEERLRVMAASRPHGWREHTGHVMLAWPTETVFDNGRFVGFLMPSITSHATVELHRVVNPTDREEGTSFTAAFTWKYLVATARNLARAVDALHKAEVVIGDFNERNVLVWSDSRVTLLDCDSMQITDPIKQRKFLCTVGRAEFTPPELQGANWHTTVRTESSDLFALAIHIHQLLLEGEFPFGGVWHRAGDMPHPSELARRGLWVHAGNSLLTPRPDTLEIGVLPPDIIGLFRQAFVDGAINPRRRPSASRWNVALSALSNSLATCSRDQTHVYSQHLARCPWCDQNAKRSVTQVRLPPVRTPQTPLNPRVATAPNPVSRAPVRPAVRTPTPAPVTRAPSAIPATSASAPPSPTSTTRTPTKKGKVGWILLSVGVAIAGGAYLRHSTPPAAWTSLVGQCTTISFLENAKVSYADNPPTPVLEHFDCSEPHDAEIYAAVNINGSGLFLTEWPGQDSVTDQTNKACAAKFPPYIGRAYSGSEFDIFYLSANEENWARGHHTALCSIAIGESITGTVKGSGR